MSKGKLFVVEGACDGIGKSTQFSKLNEYLLNEGLGVVNHHFPSYNTYHGAPVEKYLAGEFGNPKDNSPYFINGMYAIDRACTWYSKLKEMYDSGNIILLDRYTTSSLIYQSALIEDIDERKKFIDYIIDFEYNKLGIKEPDSVIFLYAPFDLVTEMRLSRKDNDGVINDVHERDLTFMKKVYDNAMFISEYLSWDMIKCNDGDRMRSIDEIHEDVKCLIKKKVK
jgi:dTMP kinase